MQIHDSLNELLARPIGDVADAARLLDALAGHGGPDHAQRAAHPQHAARWLLARLGEPQQRLSVFHIAGSKGKGSTALLAESILRAGGLRVGTFTSPHLVDWHERIRLDGASIDDARFVAMLETVRPWLARYLMIFPDLPATFFDVLTVMALLLFEAAPVDVAVIETGMGGLLDATNVVLPRVACITSIELEHVDRLGATLASIARHKAGIIKRGVPVVVGALPAEAMAEVFAQAAACAAPLHCLGRDFACSVDAAARDRAAQAGGLDVSLEAGGLRLAVRLPVLGAHLGRCAALALASVEKGGWLAGAALVHAARAGLANASLPGRTELLARDPWLVVDGAHTPASAEALVAALERLPSLPRHWLLSVSAGKDVDALLAILLEGAASVTVCCADPSRSLPAAALAARIGVMFPDLGVDIRPEPADALSSACGRAWHAGGAAGVLVAAGSVYLAGAVRSAYLCGIGQAKREKSSERISEW